jgi:hypothetical protein
MGIGRLAGGREERGTSTALGCQVQKGASPVRAREIVATFVTPASGLKAFAFPNWRMRSL